MPIEDVAKQVTMEDIRNEVAKIKATLVEAVDDGIRSALRAVKQGRHAAEDAIDDAKHAVRKNPAQAVGVVFLAGVVAGCLVGWMATRRQDET